MNSRAIILEGLKRVTPPSSSQSIVTLPEISRGSVEMFTEKATAAGAKVYVVQDLGEVGQKISEILAEIPGDIIYANDDLLQEIQMDDIVKNDERKTIMGQLNDKTNYKEIVLASAIGITSCHYAVAETGSVVIKHQKSNERLISLAPETYICLLKEEQILENRYMLAKIMEENPEPPSAYSIITGISRTADVALTVVLGMHGPKDVHLILCQEGGASDTPLL